MRALLCERGAEAPLELRRGPGISKREGRDFPDILRDMLQDWRSKHGPLPIVIAGMAGSNIGWRETPYLECPASLDQLLTAAVPLELDDSPVRILPGVRGKNAMAQVESMRGEELQILGWMAEKPDADLANTLLCLPGTHCKWVRLETGRITSFATALTGEVFATLQDKTVLLPDAFKTDSVEFDKTSFLTGVDLVRRYPNALLHQLFSTRSRWLSQPRTIENPHSYLSGLLIGSDTLTALHNCGKTHPVIELVGDAALCNLYQMAAEYCGFECNIMLGDLAAYKGFQTLMSETFHAA